jgi:nucleoid DNA-binding protein
MSLKDSSSFPKRATQEILEAIAKEQKIPVAKVKEALDLRGRFMKEEIIAGRSCRVKYLGLFKPRSAKLFERPKNQPKPNTPSDATDA